jgi:hypothetical protein
MGDRSPAAGADLSRLGVLCPALQASDLRCLRRRVRYPGLRLGDRGLAPGTDLSCQPGFGLIEEGVNLLLVVASRKRVVENCLARISSGVRDGSRIPRNVSRIAPRKASTSSMS